MNERLNRRISAVVGVFLVLVAGAIVVLGDGLLETPVLLVQVTLMGVAGVCDIIAATDTRLTARWAWYRWGGLGNILLGLSLPLGFAESGTGRLFVVVVAIGGLSLGLMGVDMLVYHGKYTRDERLDRDGT
ncbi:hypothetical protein [Natrinema altunense]|uniref:Uncharacterized protein n=1 Tax=Natrinema altunense TaxID=222984 RepID=A0A482XZ72_9EURY|nr:hypothetical protein [Natrinema altunense]RZH67195.1 hypothetical protein ELS17_15740 [Natrinema altunense]